MKWIILCLCMMFLSCAHCWTTSSYAEAEQCRKLGGKVSKTKYGDYKVCLDKKLIKEVKK